MNELTLIGRKYGTDKAGQKHMYTEKAYYSMFKDIRYEKIKLLELGVGDTGASVKMWREFFPNAEIYLFDPFFIAGPPKTDVTVTRQELIDLNIIPIKGNQLSRTDLLKIVKICDGDFDIIVDDASHMSDGIQISLATLLPHLKDNGLYIVEDTSTAHDRGLRLNEVNAWLDSEDVSKNEKIIYHKGEIHLLYSLFEFRKTGRWPSNVLTDREKEYLENNIEGYFHNEYHNNLAIIRKSSCAESWSRPNPHGWWVGNGADPWATDGVHRPRFTRVLHFNTTAVLALGPDTDFSDMDRTIKTITATGDRVVLVDEHGRSWVCDETGSFVNTILSKPFFTDNANGLLRSDESKI